jgi:gamma-glutamylcyclotransferase (GGCT)/AIG2-like uncharacterized protein YtfP
VAAMMLLGETPGRASIEQLEDAVDRALQRPSQRLAAYGSLRRSERNHGEVADLGGRWLAGHVRGRFEPAAVRTGGWPALTPDAHGEPCAVEVLESLALSTRWPHLDAFEGAAYRRELALVDLEGGATCVANLYVPALSG